MINHTDLGPTPFGRNRALATLIIKGEITLGGYKKGKIYGTLSCGSGKRMKTENRVFFADEQEAIAAGYRPCGNCMPEEYKLWKQKGCHAEPVEAWWVGLYARPFDGAQGDSPLFVLSPFLSYVGCYPLKRGTLFKYLCNQIQKQ